MIVLKKINHNALLADDNGVEKIAMGKGIGFSAEINQEFPAEKADKIFVLDSEEKTKLFAQLVSEIPLEFIEFSEEIIRYIKTNIQGALDSNIYITLTDHVYFAIRRRGENSNIAAIMIPEMKLLYPDEFNVASAVVQQINQKYGTELDDNEAGFILMHILNAQHGDKNSLNNLKILEMSKFILDTVNEESKTPLDQNSMKYHRFLVHVKFLTKRIVYREPFHDVPLDFLDPRFKETERYQIARSVADKLHKRYGVEMSPIEIDYLAIHLTTLGA